MDIIHIKKQRTKINVRILHHFLIQDPAELTNRMKTSLLSILHTITLSFQQYLTFSTKSLYSFLEKTKWKRLRHIHVLKSE